MVNLRELEIRNQSLSITVTAYDLVSRYSGLVSFDDKNQLLDNCFYISSKIAEAFRSLQNEVSQVALHDCLNRLIDLQEQVSLLLPKDAGAKKLLSNFLRAIDNLLAELYFLLDTLEELSAEEFSPKLELACI